MPYYKDEIIEDFMPYTKKTQPSYWTPMKSKASLGYDIIRFIEKYFTPPRTMNNNEPFRLKQWQKELLIHMFELDTWGRFVYREFFWFIPRKNSKSFLASAICAYFLAKAQGGEEIYCVAKNSKQARVVYKETTRNIVGPLLKVIKPGQQETKNRFVNAVFMPLSGDANGAHGKAPYFSVLDEFHAWDSLTGKSNYAEEMVEALKTGSLDRNEFMILIITTAGNNDQGIAREYYDKAIMVATGELVDERFGCAIWCADDDDDISDRSVWEKANPMVVEGVLSFDEMEKEFKAAEQTGTGPFEKFHLNKWLRNSDKAEFISAFHWKNAFKPELGKIPKGAEIVVGFDGSLTEDSTGLVAIDLETGLIEVLYGWEKEPNNPDWFVEVDEVDAGMEDIQANYVVRKVYCDPSRHQSLVAQWRRRYGNNVIRDIPQSSQRMAPMSQEFKTDVYTGKLFHVGERRLTTHVRNAIETIRGVPNKEKPNSPRKIDFLACAVLANGARHEYQERTRRQTRVTTF